VGLDCFMVWVAFEVSAQKKTAVSGGLGLGLFFSARKLCTAV
jgi:hypothetical protein